MFGNENEHSWLASYQNNHALIAAKMTPISNQIFVCGPEPRPQSARMSAAAKNATPTTARIYLAATPPQPIVASMRRCRHAGALVLNSCVPGSSKHR